uniref:Ovule protein n=1 Tax=Heterorhabditis bacteriophora TaxID=37862 RepID=A0A1I7XEQ9_HETBA
MVRSSYSLISSQDLTYFPRLTVLRSPLDSYKVNLMVKCLCHKSRETATTTAEQLFCLHDPVPVLFKCPIL